MWSSIQYSVVGKEFRRREVGDLVPFATEGYLARRTVRLWPWITPSVTISLADRGAEACSRPWPWLHFTPGQKTAPWGEQTWGRTKPSAKHRSDLPCVSCYKDRSSESGFQKRQQRAPTQRTGQRTGCAQRTDRCLGMLAPRQSKRARHNKHRTASGPGGSCSHTREHSATLRTSP